MDDCGHNRVIHQGEGARGRRDDADVVLLGQHAALQALLPGEHLCRGFWPKSKVAEVDRARRKKNENCGGRGKKKAKFWAVRRRGCPSGGVVQRRGCPAEGLLSGGGSSGRFRVQGSGFGVQVFADKNRNRTKTK